MSETRTYIVPEQPQQNPNDNLAMMAMLNGNGGFGGNGMWNNPFMYLVWMWMMRWMNNGWGENGDCQNAGLSRQIQTLQEQMQDNHNSDLIMQGINGNADAIREAADKIGCNFNVLNQAVCGIRSSIDQVSGQLGFTGERIINAINSGDCKVIEAINSCCCNTQKAIIEQGYQNQLANERQTYQITNSINQASTVVDKGFTTLSFQNQTQTCDLQNAIRDTSNTSTSQIIAKLDAMQNQALLDKIDALREKNSQQAVVINNAQQTAAFGQMISQATTPIVAAVNALQGDVNGIKCKLPETVTLPYSCATAVPTQAVFNGYALGAYAGWNGCGCNNSLWG